MRPDNTWDPTSERAKKAMKISNDDGKKSGVSGEVMMTEAVVDEEGGPYSGLGKCLVHVPRNWKSDKLITFLNEQASWVFDFRDNKSPFLTSQLLDCSFISALFYRENVEILVFIFVSFLEQTLSFYSDGFVSACKALGRTQTHTHTQKSL